ncbi:hypothetical protein [Lacinutrix salivirga]
MSKFFYSCEEANHVCDKNQYKEATLLEKIKLNFHVIGCAVCRKYSAKNGKLSKLLRKNKVAPLETSTKEKMKLNFEKELEKLQQQ